MHGILIDNKDNPMNIWWVKWHKLCLLSCCVLCRLAHVSVEIQYPPAESESRTLFTRVTAHRTELEYFGNRNFPRSLYYERIYELIYRTKMSTYGIVGFCRFGFQNPRFRPQIFCDLWFYLQSRLIFELNRLSLTAPLFEIVSARNCLFKEIAQYHGEQERDVQILSCKWVQRSWCMNHLHPAYFLLIQSASPSPPSKIRN